MNPVALIPENAPFSPEQRAWLNGFLAALFSQGPALNPSGGQPAEAAAKAGLAPLTILFGSQTGTAENLAKRAAKEAGRRGFAATVMDMAAFGAAQLAQEKNVLVITSTFGEGDPPDNAKALHSALGAANAPRIEGLRFSVCGLGDTNYLQFCRCAQDFDARLEKLGAVRVKARVDCDVDYEEKFVAWLDAALAAFAGTPGSAPRPAAPPLPAEATPSSGPEPAYSKKNPFPAPVATVRCLNRAGSSKEVNHVEISLAGSGLVYEAGDALGILPHNCPELVGEVLALLGCDGEEAVPSPDGSVASLRKALTEHYDLGKPSPELLERLAAAASAIGESGGRRLPASTGSGEAIRRPEMAPPQVIDLLAAQPASGLAPADFVRCLRRLQPRLYSISSSPKAHPGEVHLTVGTVRYEAGGRRRKGVCSTFLAERALGAGRVGVFVHSNRAFRPPAAGGTPMIMVGPGTGIAPFRAFLEERRAAGAPGRNWLFFGDQHAATDYLYREELEAMRDCGLLTRLDTAFSRDQAEKIYVQNRIVENAAEIFAWLEEGAHFYVCGDASRMAKDVEAALHRVIEVAGGKDAAQAVDYVNLLRSAKRYARDVY